MQGRVWIVSTKNIILMQTICYAAHDGDGVVDFAIV